MRWIITPGHGKIVIIIFDSPLERKEDCHLFKRACVWVCDISWKKQIDTKLQIFCLKKNGKSRIAINDSWKFYFSFYFQQLNVSWLQVFKRLKNANIWQHFIHWYNNKLNQELSLMTRYKSYQYNPILSFQHKI